MKNLKQVGELLNRYEVDGEKFSYYVEASEVAECIEGTDAIQFIEEQIDEGGGFNGEVIYYHNAIKYLADNDSSLHECMEIASEMGYKVEDLNSELLASLLKSRNLREEFSDIAQKFESDFDELEDEEEEEEPDEDEDEED